MPLYLDIFIVYRILSRQYFFFSTLEKCFKVFWLTLFLWEICHLSSLFFCVFFHWLLLRFYSVPPVLSNLIITECNVFSQGSLNFLDRWVCNFHLIWKSSGHCFQIFLLPPLLYLGDFNYVCNWLLEIALQFTDALFFCLFIRFSPLFHFDSFYCCVFKFINLFFHNIQSDINLIQYLLISDTAIFTSRS